MRLGQIQRCWTAGGSHQVTEQAMRLNPRYPDMYLVSLGIAYRVAGRYEEALVPLKKFLSLNPNWWHVQANLAACYASWADWKRPELR